MSPCWSKPSSFAPQGGENPIRALHTDKAKIVLDQIRTRVWSGTAQIFTNNLLLRQHFWYDPHFWDGKWRADYYDNLIEWADLHGGWTKLFGGWRAEGKPEGYDKDEEEEVE